MPIAYSAFRAWALAEAWTGSYAMDGLARSHGYKTISRLGGDFLRMYLRHSVDDTVVEAAGKEIGSSVEFGELRGQVEGQIQTYASKTLKRLPTATEIAEVARGFLKTKYRTEGIAFRGPLNPVIGGIEGVDVRGDAIIDADPNLLSKSIEAYKLNVWFEDKYKFLGNRRSGGKKDSIADQPEYDIQRKHWADLLLHGQYGRLFLEYHEAFYFEKKSLREGVAFASFMYAIESINITPGPLGWGVVVPMAGVVGLPP